MNKKEILTELPPNEVKGFSRRNFLGLTGGLLAAGALLNASCNNDDDSNPMPGVTLTNDDFGILNYAYALEQLEAAFYSRVVETGFYDGATASEKALLTDIRDHEIAHREFFKAALGAKAIGSLGVNFSTIDFKNRTSVLGTAKVFEDLGVSAYNGAGVYIQSTDYLLLAGKIVSVEARHAAYIRDLISNGTFASGDAQIDMNGMDISKKPSVVLAAASAFITTKINSNLP
ncbi:MAG TPA: ferritin-like domain-containing protein [Flavipsychrobacter sp.]|nr:ferritin-like domain-containing protein [Flavipsychrobacter sp.]